MLEEWMSRYIVFSAPFLVLWSITFSQHVPLWHKPNDFHLDGSSCSSVFPSHHVTCPPFGVLVNGPNLVDAATKKCQSLGFEPCPVQYQLANGLCSAEGSTNPFDCVNGEDQQYLPCYQKKVEVPNYYSGYNRVQTQIMETCAGRHPEVSKAVTKVLPFPKSSNETQVFGFPIVFEQGASSQNFGYLQCPRSIDPVPREEGSFWIGVGLYNGGLFSFLLIYAVYKRLIERRLRLCTSLFSVDDETEWNRKIGKKVESGESSRGKGALMSDNTAASLGGLSESDSFYFEKSKRRKRLVKDAVDNVPEQSGYRRDVLGSLAYFSMWLISIGWFLFMLIIVLDIYGLLVWNYCGDAARQACTEAAKTQQLFSLRTGFACGSSCFFSKRWTSGQSPLWPYNREPGGGFERDAVFIGVWYLALLWFVIVKMYEPRIPSFFRIRCPLESATVVVVSAPICDQQPFGKESSRAARFVRVIFSFFSETHTNYTSCPVKKTASGVSYIDFQSLRYRWSDSSLSFEPSVVSVGRRLDDIKKLANGLTTAEASQRIQLAGENTVDVKVPGFLRSCFNEFFDWLYIYQCFMIWVWMASFYWGAGLVVLFVVVFSGLVKVYTQTQSLKQVHTLAGTASVVTVRRDGVWKPVSSSRVSPGDVVQIVRGEVPCDCALVQGTCMVDESSLTGESMPLSKTSNGAVGRQTWESLEGTKHVLFAGSIVKGVGTELVIAVAVRTGARSQRGRLIRGMMTPSCLQSKLDEQLKVVIFLLILWGCGVMGIIGMLVRWRLQGWYFGISTLSQILSPLIPALFVGTCAVCASRLSSLFGIRCVSLGRILICGRVQTFCFDKTGTLTQQGLKFHGVIPIAGGSCSRRLCSGPLGVVESEKTVSYGMACAHELSVSTKGNGSSNGKPVGNEVDMRMFAASGFTLRLANGGWFTVSKNEVEFKILRRFQFDRSSMTMSCVVEDQTRARFVFVKGTTESVIARCNIKGDEYIEVAKEMEMHGFYTLCLAYKTYAGPDDVEGVNREEVESDLSPIGLLLFVNELKPEAIDVVRELKEGSIRPVMITGDSLFTASRVARDCGLSVAARILMADCEPEEEGVSWKDFDTGMVVKSWTDVLEDLEAGTIEIGVTGQAFDKLCEVPPPVLRSKKSTALSEPQINALLKYTSIFARMKPEQKVEAVKCLMMTSVTAFCGDGSNDASALRGAHVGLALGNLSYVKDDTTQLPANSESTAASMVAPFATPYSSLTAATRLLKEGRCALASSFAGYKGFMVYGEAMVVVSLLVYYFGINLSEAYWITVDTFVNLGMVWAVTQSRPKKRITPIRPTAELLGLEVVGSVLLQITLNAAFIVGAVYLLFQQPFFVCREFDSNLVEDFEWWKKADNYEAAVISIVSLFQLINSAAIFNFGFDYRAAWKKNIWVLFYWIAGLVVSFLILFAPYLFVSCLFRINCGDNSLLERWSAWNILPVKGYVASAPPGCACSSQIAAKEADLCENEYLDCQSNHFNSRFHHNIIPGNFRLILLGLVIANTLVGFLCEWLFIVGPVRRKLRARKQAKQQRLRAATSSSVIRGEDTIFCKIDSKGHAIRETDDLSGFHSGPQSHW